MYFEKLMFGALQHSKGATFLKQNIEQETKVNSELLIKA